MKLKLLVLTTALAVTSFHCSDCGDDVLPYFDAQGIAGSEVWIVSPSTKAFNYSESTIITGNNLLGISFFFHGSYYSKRKEKDLEFSLIASALACDPQPNGYKGSKERFKSITISSDEAVDANHSAGVSLNDLFEVRNEEHVFIPLSQFLSSTSAVFNPNFEFILSKKLPTGKSFIFKLRVELTNGEVYETVTKPVLFK